MTKVNNEAENRAAIEIVRGKLTSSAATWFDDNESSFNQWSDFEIAFRNKYLSTRAIHQKVAELKRRKQAHDEPVSSYLDGMVSLCREIDPNMPDVMIISYTMSGIIPQLQMELSRREASTTTLTEFMKYANIEQDLCDTFMKPHQSSLDTQQQPYFETNHWQTPTITVMNKPSNQHHYSKPNEGRFNRTPTQESSSQPKKKFSTSVNQNGNYSKQSTHYQTKANN